MFNDNTHHKCASIVGWLNLQAPSIATVVTVGRSRQSTSNDPCSDNWNTFEQVTVINTSSLNKSYVGGRMQIGHNRVYFTPNQVSENWTITAQFEWNSDTNGKFRRMFYQDWHWNCRILILFRVWWLNETRVCTFDTRMRPYRAFPAENCCGYFVKPANLYMYNIDNVWHDVTKRDYYSIIIVNSYLYATLSFKSMSNSAECKNLQPLPSSEL